MPHRALAFFESLPSDLRKTIAGAIGSFSAFVASYPLKQINEMLQTASLLIGIALAAVTLYRAFRHPDLESIMQRQMEMAENQDRIFKRLGEIDEHGCTRHRNTVRQLSKAKEDEA